MADIYLAHASTAAGVERHVVLKRVLAEHSRNPQFAKMFLDEARLAAQLQHPNIAQVLDIGVLAGSYFFTMEYVHGKDVRQLLHRLVTQKRELPITFALHVAAGALAALHHAHERTSPDHQPLGVVHRDVSPSNVMVSYEGVIKLLDFGVAKATQNTTETRSGTIKGKISYLSPEQCQTKPVDRRSDIFALGIVLYEMLTCRRLYRRDSDFAAMEAIVHEVPRPPSSVRPEISADLDRIVLRALAKAPADRFATAADMLEAIEQVAAREHHVLSATAMGRFMRELFGERKEPWNERAGTDPTAMTITGESIAALDSPDSQQRALEAQLEHAPLLATGDASAGEADLSVPPLPPPPAKSRLVPVLVLVLVLAGAGIAAFLLLGSHPTPTTAPAPRDAAIAHVDAPPGPPADAALADTAPAIDAPARSIESALAAGDWIGTLELCVAQAHLDDASKQRCAIAACNAKQTPVALGYYTPLPAASRAAVERACQIHGISLRPQHGGGGKDPCDIDPLSCQR